MTYTAHWITAAVLAFIVTAFSCFADTNTHTSAKETIDTATSVVKFINEVKKSKTQKQSADLIVKSVSVYSTKENGSPWDKGHGKAAKPDLKVIIKRGLKSLDTGTESDSMYASYNNKKLRVREGDEIKIKVYDQDAFNDDLVGSYLKEISAATLRQGTITWSFDRVKALVIEFEL